MGVARRRRRKMGDFQPKTVFFIYWDFRVEPPLGVGGWGSDLKFLSFWTPFLKFLSPMVLRRLLYREPVDRTSL